MIEFYLKLYKAGKIKLETIPEKYREQVKAKLEK